MVCHKRLSAGNWDSLGTEKKVKMWTKGAPEQCHSKTNNKFIEGDFVKHAVHLGDFKGEWFPNP